MSEMVKRATEALEAHLDLHPPEAVTGGFEPATRAALLAALDLSEVEQQQLFEDDADHDGRVHNESVRATLQKLRAFAQGGSVE